MVFFLERFCNIWKVSLPKDFLDFNINARQYGILLFIEGNPYSSQKDISENLQIDRTMVSHIDHLETLEFVERTKNPNDRRSHSLMITTKGKEVLDSCWEFLSNVESKFLTPLNQQEKQLLKEFSVKIWVSL